MSDLSDGERIHNAVRGKGFFALVFRTGPDDEITLGEGSIYSNLDINMTLEQIAELLEEAALIVRHAGVEKTVLKQ